MALAASGSALRRCLITIASILSSGALADWIGLPVLQPASLRELQPASLRDPAVQALLAAVAPEAVFSIGYGKILPPAVLGIPRLRLRKSSRLIPSLVSWQVLFCLGYHERRDAHGGDGALHG